MAHDAVSPSHTTPPSPTSRRTVLRASTGVLVGLAAVPAVAACGSDDDGQASTGSSASTAGGGGASGALAALEDIPVGGAIAVSAGGQNLLLARPTDTTVVAYSSKCPHQGCRVGVGDGKFACPCHGAEFTLDTGEITKDPDPRGTTSGLTTVAVAVEGGNVVTA